MESIGEGGFFVARYGDRFDVERRVFGVIPFPIKVSARDTDGALLVIKPANAFPGGPPLRTP